MKKLILAATLFAPLALAAPALADDSAGFVETPAVSTYAPNQPREFTARHGQVANADQSLISREVVPSSAFSSTN
ncbi:hypothetical protein [Phreatobacter stygius]|uniref:DUF4148 domain-containing protein n=1 Tax=Phreatobacter stygius TaxID=1940610 RepID=A0A4D7B6T6_9HYPH|nr:hypothetical protein [Phreatobacter stygius]QCI66765.1 hypothetical protein E8M01_22495 [Phreatobacter stygius]